MVIPRTITGKKASVAGTNAPGTGSPRLVCATGCAITGTDGVKTRLKHRKNDKPAVIGFFFIRYIILKSISLKGIRTRRTN
jgi:hypothetical protein